MKLTAFHESAHAVLAWALGCYVLLIELYDEATQKMKCVDGRASYYFLPPDSNRLRAIVVCLIAIAGPLQEEKMGAEFKLSGSDLKTFQDLAAIVDKDELNFLVPKIREIAEILIEYFADEIELLAEALLRNGRILEREEIKRLLGDPIDPSEAIKILGKIMEWKCPIAA